MNVCVYPVAVISVVKDQVNVRGERVCLPCRCHLCCQGPSKCKTWTCVSAIDNKFDIIVLTEIGNDGDNYINRNLLSDYDAFIDLPKNNRYDGVAILVKRGYGDIIQREDLKITKTCDCDRCQMEDIWVEIKTGNENFILSAIYRHPNWNVEHFTNDLEESFSKLKIGQTCRDININLMKYENNMTLAYFTTLSSYNFMPYISTPTPITDNS